MALTKSQNKIQLGDKAPDFTLLGIDGKNHSLKDFQGRPVLIIFMCNHCPYVKAKINDIKNIQERFNGKLQIIGINSNDPDYDKEDSFENMKVYAKKGNYNFIYLFDETQNTARKYGASCTPDPFLFNKSHELVYHGRINDSMEPNQKAKAEDMKKAIELTLAGKKIDFEIFPSIGCSIKWK